MSEQVIDAPPPLESQWSVVGVCALQVIATLAGPIIVGFVMGFVGGAAHLLTANQNTAGDLAFFQLIAIVSLFTAAAMNLYFARDRLKGRLLQLLPDMAEGLRRPVSLLVLLCLPLGLLGTLHWAMTTPQATKTFLHETSPFIWLGYAVALAVVTPVAEEIFYRGYVWNRLSSLMPSWKAGTISAAIFLSAHIPNGLVAPLLVLPLTIIVTVMRLRRVGLGLCVAAHAIYNGTILLGNVVQTYLGPFHIFH